MASTSALASFGRVRAQSRLVPTTASSSSASSSQISTSPLYLSSPPSSTPFVRVRCFHSSPTHYDHYKTLGVDRSASPKDIKNSFYALSKKFHPDVNRDDDGAKKKFQEVSEAWSILGDEKNKREYDRQLRYGPSMGSTGSYSSGMAGRRYDGSDNSSRRARATYAWDYQRRKSDSNRSKAGQAQSQSRTGFGSGEFRASSSSSRSLFEEHAARQKRREDFLNARSAAANSGGSSTSTTNTSSLDKEREAETGSVIIRFMQMALAVSAIGLVAFSSRKKVYNEGCGEEEREEEWYQSGSHVIAVDTQHSIDHDR